ncbi:MAG: radical SAM protein [Fusobacteriaceae bacterium]
MKAIRILLTENCNASCPSCFNADFRNGENMDKKSFFELCDYLSNNQLEKIKIMGGEPTIHPDFLELIQYAQTKLNGVHIFTNSLSDKIYKVELREKDSIIYNSLFLKENFDIKKLRLDALGTRALETQISSDSNIDNMIANFKRIINEAIKQYGYEHILEKIGINMTLNCCEDIFKNKEVIIEKWNKFYDFVKEELKIDVVVDHSVPWCFFVNTNMKIKQGIWKCSSECSGLIDSSFNLRYCNQLPTVLTPLKIEGLFIPMKILKNYLYMENLNKITSNLNKICKNCIFFNDKCNGGCFMHKEFIPKTSIIENTNLPKINKILTK